MGVKNSIFLIELIIFFGIVVVEGHIISTLEGPFEPVTIPLDERFRGNAIDLPDNDPRVVRTVNGFQPEQISLSLSSTFDSVWVSWVTGEYQIGENIKPLDPKSVASVVRYGEASSSLNHEAKGDSLIYSQLYPFEGLRNYTSGIIHHVRLTGLKPDTNYYYQCGDPSIDAMSKLSSFKTMPVSSPTSYPKKIAVLGDLGLTYNSTSTVDHIKSHFPDLVLLVGDVTYANLYLTNGTGSDCYSCSFPDSPIHETYQPRWDYWGRYMQPLLSKVPIMVVEGNHEIEEQVDNITFKAYSSRFAFPSEESGSGSTFYYSFDAGGIHFVMLGAYIAYDKSADQYKWLERDLAKVNRKVTPWLVAVYHPPWYSTYTAHYREVECMREAMEELLYTSGVDIVFNGHVHAYERSNRVYNYTLDPCGPIHVTVGDGGNREKMAISYADEPGNCPEPSTTPDDFIGGFCAFNFTSGPAAGKFCWDKQPEYSAYRESSFGHGILEVKNDTHALWTWHRNQDMYYEAGDQIYIVRQPDKCPVEQKESRGIMVKICACPMLWGPFNKKVWSPSPSCSSTSSSCNSCCCIHNNTGFLVYDINGDGVKKHENIASCYGGTTIYKGAQMDDWITSLAKFGVTTHNVNQNADLEFVRVVGASHTGLSSLLYHITLEATSGRKHRIFHAVVWLQPLKNSMELLVWRSIHDALSVVGVKRGDLKLHEAVMHLMNLRKESSIPGLIT